MAKTPNLGLHQWGANDAFLREDFNSDFSKIDTAVGEVAAWIPYEKLLDVTTQQSVSRFDVDISGIQWEKYYKAILRLSVRGAYNAEALLRFNGRGDNVYSSSSGFCNGQYDNYGKTNALLRCGVVNGSSISACAEMNFLVEPDDPIFARYLQYSRASSFAHTVLEGFSIMHGVTYRELTSLNIAVTTGQVEVGTRMTLWGVKR